MFPGQTPPAARRKECAAVCSPAKRGRPAVAVRAETSPVWARAESTTDLRATTRGLCGFPPGNGTSCRCRPGRGGNAFARNLFNRSGERDKGTKKFYFQGLDSI